MIFTEQEVKDRFNLHQFIMRLFTPCKKGQSDFKNGIDAQTIYELFCIHQPHNVLSGAIVNNMLLTGGFIETEDEELNVLHAKIHKETYDVLDKKSKLIILGLAKEKPAITLRQVLLEKVTVQGIKQAQVDAHVQLFFKIFTLNFTNRYFYQFTNKSRSTLKDGYEYYLFICTCFHMRSLSRKQWLNELATLGVKRAKGCVDGQAGQIYFSNMYIPKSREDLALTLDWGMCCLSNGTTHATSLEDLLENLSPGTKNSIFQQNLERLCLDESSRKAIKKEKEETDCWRTAQAEALFVCTREEKKAAKNHMGHNGGSQSESKKIETQTLQTESQAEISRTSGFNTAKGDSASATEYPIRVTDAESGEIANNADIGSPADDILKPGFENVEGGVGSGKDDAESGNDTSDDGEPSLSEIANALRVPYKMSPDNFTQEVMADWCNKMSVHVNLDDYYDILMELIKELD